MQKEILIVEDDPDINKIEDIILTEEGIRVFSVADGLSAIDFLQRRSEKRRRFSRYHPLYQRYRPLDTVLMDYKLRQGIDGVQTARMIKLLGPEEAKIPIIFVTATSEETLKKAVPDIDTLGSILGKPFDLDTLVIRVNEVTRRQV